MIHPLPSLHPHARRLVRWVLLWFALSLGVAVAAPWVAPGSMQMVCTSGGPMKLVQLAEDGSAPTASATLDCPLCLTALTAPPLTIASLPLLDAACATPQALRPAAPPATRAAGVLARGPPASL